MVIEKKRERVQSLPVFYPRKIGKAGSTRTLSVGKILPSDWAVVKVTIEKLEGNICILKIERLV